MRPKTYNEESDVKFHPIEEFPLKKEQGPYTDIHSNDNELEGVYNPAMLKSDAHHIETPRSKRVGSEKEEVKHSMKKASSQIKVPQALEATFVNAEQFKELEECMNQIKVLTEHLTSVTEERNKLQDEAKRLKEELRETHNKHNSNNLQQQFNKQLATINENHLKEIEEIRENNAKLVAKLEIEKEELIRLERQFWEKQMTKLEEMHRIDIENIEKQKEHSVNVMRRLFDNEVEEIKKTCKHEGELGKIAGRVDTLITTLKAKFEMEMKERLHKVEERELAVEEKKRSCEMDKARLEFENKRLENLTKAYKEKERLLKQEIEQQKEMYKYQNESSEEHYKELFKELVEKREALTSEKKELEMQRVKVDKERRDWEMQSADERTTLLLEKKILQKTKEEFNNQMEQDTSNLKAKMSAIEYKREELIIQETELQKNMRKWEEKELQLKREYNDLQVKIDKFQGEKRELDIERQRLEQLAIQVEGESRIIYNYKSTIEKTHGELEHMRSEVDTKDLVLRRQKAKIEHSQAELELKQQALQKVQIQYLKDTTLNTLNKAVPIRPLRTNDGYKPIKKTAHRPSINSFKANEFIKDLESDLGKDTNFSDYVLSEKNLLLKSKQDVQASTLSLFNHPQSSKKTLRANSAMIGRSRERKKHGNVHYNSIESVNETIIPNKS